MIPKSLEALAQSDIDALIENAVQENRFIDYKAALPGRGDKDKREFLADVSSFANAAGGDLIFGVATSEGIPVEARGLAGADADAEKLRFENMLRDGIDPRIPGVQIREVTGFSEGPVLVLRVPRSWVAPHMVTFGNLSRFFTRTSAGKYQMDVREIRSAFVLSETLADRIRTFCADRVGRVLAEDTPVPLQQGAKTILHLVPLSAFDPLTDFSAEVLASVRRRLDPICMAYSCQPSGRFNLDGYLRVAVPNEEDALADGYCQAFRSGIVEAVDTLGAREILSEPPIQSPSFETRIVGACWRYVQGLAELDVQPPVLVAVTLTGVKDYELRISWYEPGTRLRLRRLIESMRPIDRNVLRLPEVILNALDCGEVGINSELQPAFDALWNAAGAARSPWYEGEEGTQTSAGEGNA